MCFDESNRQADESPFVGIGAENCVNSAGESGAYIVHLYAGSPAASTALRPGDRVTRFGDCPISNRSQLARAIANYTVRAPVDIVFKRSDGNAYSVRLVTSVALPRSTTAGFAKRQDDAHEAACRALGLRKWVLDGGEPAIQNPPAALGPGREFRVQNACHRTLQISFTLLSERGDWVPNGWWRFEPGETAFLNDQGQRLVVRNRTLFFYAETVEAGAVWKGDRPATVDGRALPMREVTLGDDHLLRLTCESLAK